MLDCENFITMVNLTIIALVAYLIVTAVLEPALNENAINETGHPQEHEDLYPLPIQAEQDPGNNNGEAQIHLQYQDGIMRSHLAMQARLAREREEEDDRIREENREIRERDHLLCQQHLERTRRRDDENQRQIMRTQREHHHEDELEKMKVQRKLFDQEEMEKLKVKHQNTREQYLQETEREVKMLEKHKKEIEKLQQKKEALKLEMEKMYEKLKQAQEKLQKGNDSKIVKKKTRTNGEVASRSGKQDNSTREAPESYVPLNQSDSSQNTNYGPEMNVNELQLRDNNPQMSRQQRGAHGHKKKKKKNKSKNIQIEEHLPSTLETSTDSSSPEEEQNTDEAALNVDNPVGGHNTDKTDKEQNHNKIEVGDEEHKVDGLRKFQFERETSVKPGKSPEPGI